MQLLFFLYQLISFVKSCVPAYMLLSFYQHLQDIKYDLEKNQPRVMSLRDTADQLLMNSDSPEMCQAKDKMHIIANRLKALLRLCSSYISSLESRLDTKSHVC